MRLRNSLAFYRSWHGRFDHRSSVPQSAFFPGVDVGVETEAWRGFGPFAIVSERCGGSETLHAIWGSESRVMVYGVPSRVWICPVGKPEFEAAGAVHEPKPCCDDAVRPPHSPVGRRILGIRG